MNGNWLVDPQTRLAPPVRISTPCRQKARLAQQHATPRGPTHVLCVAKTGSRRVPARPGRPHVLGSLGSAHRTVWAPQLPDAHAVLSSRPRPPILPLRYSLGVSIIYAWAPILLRRSFVDPSLQIPPLLCSLVSSTTKWPNEEWNGWIGSGTILVRFVRSARKVGG